ncbi:MAG: mycothiol synthase [Mycobacteriales bacterium]
MISLTVRTRLSSEEVTEVKALVHAVKRADGVPPLSDHVLLHLPRGGDAHVQHVLARAGDELVGYVHLDVTDQVAGPSGEVAVLPSYRRQGIGRRLVEKALALSPDGRLRLWARGENPAAARLASSLGFARTRVLRQMRRSLADLPPFVMPIGVSVRVFEVGSDEEPWTALNNEAFAAHPDQGSWSVDEVRVREKESWFDPAGFFLAVRDARLVGFHWTKVHGADGHGHPAIGEVYVVGVAPSERGTGLGKALTLLGLEHLASLGLSEALLYVDESNTAAIGLYERLGFTTWSKDVSWSR